MSYCHLEGEVQDYKKYLWNSNEEGKVFAWNTCSIKIIGALTYDRHIKTFISTWKLVVFRNYCLSNMAYLSR